MPKCYDLDSSAVRACILARGRRNIVPFPLGLEFDLSHLWRADDSWCAAHCMVSFSKPGYKGGIMFVEIADVPDPLTGFRGKVGSIDFYLTEEYVYRELRMTFSQLKNFCVSPL